MTKKNKAPHNAARVRDRYRGETATGYEAKRVGAKKWGLEHEAVRTFLNELPKDIIVADIPVGTGRYAEIYSDRDITVTGLDTSPDMLKLAQEKFANNAVTYGTRIHDALKPLPPAPGPGFDVVICTRLFNHFTLAEAQKALKNFVAVAPVVIYSLREPKHPVTRNWHKASDLESVLPQDGSFEHREIVIEDNDESRYIMVKLSRVA